MDLKLILQSTNPTSTTHFPLLFSNPSSSFFRTIPFPPKPHLVLLAQKANSTFLGQNVVLKDTQFKLGRAHLTLPVITAVVKRRKEVPFDNVIQRDKKLKLVMKIRSILVNQPDRIMPLRDLGRFRRDLGLSRKCRFTALLKRFPAIFEIVEEGVYSLNFRLTPEADRIYWEELRVRSEMEEMLVRKLRKLLMISLEKRILLEKIVHLRTDLGLPLEFRDTICRRYPQYFVVVSTNQGPALELTHWDPELAVSTAELSAEVNQAREIAEKNSIIDRPLKFNIVKLPKGLNLSKNEMRRICKFRDIPYISPYSDFSDLKSGIPEKERHACGVVHEILSLTTEKRTLVDHLTHFREEFRFSQQLRGMLIRHPDMFYVSLKGDRDSVFLREAYCDSQLIEKDRLLIIKEKLRSLVAVPRFRGTHKMLSDFGNESFNVNGLEDGSGDSEEGGDWSDIESFSSDGLVDGFDDEDDDDNDNDDWSDDEDETPPDFDDGGNPSSKQSKSLKRGNASIKTEGEVLVPVFPDGSPRECW